MEKNKLPFIDNIRILLCALVILHHLAIIYGAPGGFMYVESRLDMVSFIIMTLFVGVNQSFFMGFFFLIAAYFTPASYDKKGPAGFLAGRLKRLGVPVLFYAICLDPLIKYFLEIQVNGARVSFIAFMKAKYLPGMTGLKSGPLWFCVALLIFSIAYVLYRKFTSSHPQAAAVEVKAPATRTIILFAVLIATVSWVVRIWLPLGWSFKLLNLQFPYFPQYIALFWVGILIYRKGWLMQLARRQKALWVTLILILVFVLYPFLLVFGGALEGNIQPFEGGMTWQSAGLSVWEQLLCVSIIMVLLGRFYKKHNTQGKYARTLSRAAYTAFIIHAPFIVVASVLLKDVSIYPLLKFVLMGMILVPSCFMLSHVILKISFVRRIV